MVYFALTLHLGTCLSSLIYYRSRVFKIFKRAFSSKSKNPRELIFYIVTTVSSFISALPIFIFIIFVDEISEIVGIIGMLVLGGIYLTGGIYQYFGAKTLVEQRLFDTGSPLRSACSNDYETQWGLHQTSGFSFFVSKVQKCLSTHGLGTISVDFGVPALGPSP